MRSMDQAADLTVVDGRIIKKLFIFYTNFSNVRFL